jgi:hypothetical protein
VYAFKVSSKFKFQNTTLQICLRGRQQFPSALQQYNFGFLELFSVIPKFNHPIQQFRFSFLQYYFGKGQTNYGVQQLNYGVQQSNYGIPQFNYGVQQFNYGASQFNCGSLNPTFFIKTIIF